MRPPTQKERRGNVAQSESSFEEHAKWIHGASKVLSHMDELSKAAG
jgi:hypothetical protein